MTTFVLLKKELTEHLRTHKLLIVSVVLLVFGLASPLVLAYLPKILEMTGEKIVVQLPDFTPTDAVKSYLDSLGQMGLLATILISMGAIALERERGTAVLVLSKPVGTGPFVLAKLLGLAAVLVAGMVAGALGNYGYTAVLLGPPDAMAFAVANLLAGLYLLAVISVTLFLSSLIRNQIGAGVLSLGVVLVMGLLSMVPALEPYLPSSLMHWAYGVSAGTGDSRWAALAVTWAVVVVCTVAAGRVLHRQEL
ncbi:MAG: ABC transporter permease subunit [Chloroflexota bacterium]